MGKWCATFPTGYATCETNELSNFIDVGESFTLKDVSRGRHKNYTDRLKEQEELKKEQKRLIEDSEFEEYLYDKYRPITDSK